MIVVHIIASNIFGSFVLNGWGDFLSNQAGKRRLTGILTNLLDCIPKDRQVASFRIAEISCINLEGGEWIGTCQLYAPRESGVIFATGSKNSQLSAVSVNCPPTGNRCRS